MTSMHVSMIHAQSVFRLIQLTCFKIFKNGGAPGLVSMACLNALPMGHFRFKARLMIGPGVDKSISFFFNEFTV